MEEKNNKRINCKYGIKKSGGCKKKPGPKVSRNKKSRRRSPVRSRKRRCIYGVKKSGGCKKKPGPKKVSRSRSKPRRNSQRKSRRRRSRSKSRRRSQRKSRSRRSRSKFGFFWDKKHYLCTYGKDGPICHEFNSKRACDKKLSPAHKKLSIQCVPDKRVCLKNCEMLYRQGKKDAKKKQKYKDKKEDIYNEKINIAKNWKNEVKYDDILWTDSDQKEYEKIRGKLMKKMKRKSKLKGEKLAKLEKLQQSFRVLAQKRRNSVHDDYNIKKDVYPDVWVYTNNTLSGKVNNCVHKQNISRAQIEKAKLSRNRYFDVRFYRTEKACRRNHK